MIDLTIDGGYANLRRGVSVAEDGAATCRLGGIVSTKRVSSTELERMVDDLENSGLFASDGTFEADGADLQRYVLAYDGATVTAYDGAIPRALQRTIDTLEALLFS